MKLRNLPWKEQALAKAIAEELAAVLPSAIEDALANRDAAKLNSQAEVPRSISR